MKKTILLFALIVCAFSVTPIQAMQPGIWARHSHRLVLNPEHEGQLPHTAFVELLQKTSFKVSLPNARKADTTQALMNLFGEYPTVVKITLEYLPRYRGCSPFKVEYDLPNGIKREFHDSE